MKLFLSTCLLLAGFGTYAFGAPSASDARPAAAKYAFVDPNHQVPQALLKQALDYYEAHYAELRNKSYLGVVDFSAYSGKARFFIVNMTTGSVSAIHVAHGMGSDPSFTGYAKKFSNVGGSDMSSLGVYMTAEEYDGKHGHSMRLDGLSPTNSDARAREIVVHSAVYVHESDAKSGRSDGCLAVAPTMIAGVLSDLHDGAVILAGLSEEAAGE